MNPKQVMNLIKSRRSVRNYKPDPVPQKIIDKILEAGTWAPSAMNRQPWKFVVITDKKIIKELSDGVKKVLLKNEAIMKIARFAERFTSQKDLVFYGAPLLIFVVGKKEYEWMPLDTGLAAQNMFLYAYSEGLGCCWIGFAHQLNKDPEALGKLKIPNDHQIYGVFIFGYPAEKAHKKDRNKPTVIGKF
jgi:nitroreductase